MMVQEHHLLAAFVQRVRRGLTLRRLLQGGIMLLTVCLTVLLLGVGVQHIVSLAPLVAPLYSLLALGASCTWGCMSCCRRCARSLCVRRSRASKRLTLTCTTT